MYCIPSGYLIPSKSLQVVVTSVSTKVTQLFIASSEHKPCEPKSEASAKKLIAYTQQLTQSLKAFTKVVIETTPLDYPNDSGVEEEVNNAASNLLLAGDNLLLSSQILVSTNPVPSQADLTSCVSKTFQSLVMLLLCLDNAEIRRIVSHGNQVEKDLLQLKSSNTPQTTLDCYKKLGESVAMFHKSSQKRCKDLVSTKTQQKLEKSLLNLKHAMPMLATALNMSISYPNNKEGWKNKEFAWQLVNKVTADIINIMRCPLEKEETLIGVIIQCIQRIEDLLHVEKRNSLSPLQVEAAAQSLVQQIMKLVLFANERGDSYQSTTSSLIKECHQFLALTSKLTRCKTQKESPLDFASICRSICGKTKVLNKLSNKLVTGLFTDVFAITFEPMTNLADVYRQFSGNREDPIMAQKLEILLDTFLPQAATQLECAKLANSLCEDADVFAQMHSCIENLATTKNQVEKVTTRSLASSDDSVGDLGEMETQWKDGIKSIILFCSKCIGQDSLTAYLEEDIINDFTKCNEDIVDLDELKLSSDVIQATGKARLLATVTQLSVDQHTEPIFRNGVLAHVRKLKDSIARVVASGNHLIEDVARLPSQEGFLAAASSLQSQVANVNLSLRSKCNHPDLTSNARKGLRDFSDQDLISGTIKEMHVLNQKLAALGFHANVGPLSFNREEENDQETIQHGKMSPRFSEDFHPIVGDFLQAMHAHMSEEEISKKFNLVAKASDMLVSMVTECEHCLKTCPVRVKTVTNNPTFITTLEGGSDLTSISDASVIWLKSHSETINIMREKHNIVDDNMWESFCRTWSQSFEFCLKCCSIAAELYTIGLRRYMGIYDDNESVAEALNSSMTSELRVSSSQDPLVALRRNCDTYITLVKDVVMLSRQQNQRVGDGDKSGSLQFLGKLYDECKDLVGSVLQIENEIKQLSRKVETGASRVEKSWLHIQAMACAAKISLLSSKCGEVSKLVLGVRSLSLPVECFQTSDSSKLLNYKRRARTLTSSILDKVKKTLNAGSLELNEFSKVTKVKDRIDVTCGSIEKIVEFLVLQIPGDNLLNHHGNIIDHLMFLHHRFILEVSRVNLLAKQLESSGGKCQDRSPFAAPESFTEGDTSLTLDERLANLVEERKSRDRELLSTLSC